METHSYIIIGGLITIITVLVKVIEHIIISKISFKRNGKNGEYKIGNPINFHDLESKVNSLVEILKEKDENGVHLCYFPRNIVRLNERTLEKLDVIINLLAKKA